MGRVSAIVGVVVCVIACAACTRGGDTASSGSTSGADDAARTIAVYLARDGKVAPVRRVIHAPQEEAVSSALDALTHTRPTAEERSAGYVNAVPPRRGDVEVAGGVARVVTGAGSLSRLAQAQVVYTLTDLPGVERVAFVVDGREGRPLTGHDFEAETPQILVRSPLPGETVRSPIRLEGTANVFEATVSIDVRNARGAILERTFTTATSGTGTRGTFDTRVDVPARPGDVTVVAYEASAKDGSKLHVVEVPLELTR